MKNRDCGQISTVTFKAYELEKNGGLISAVLHQILLVLAKI